MIYIVDEQEVEVDDGEFDKGNEDEDRIPMITPTSAPTLRPTMKPTMKPTPKPTMKPTPAPTIKSTPKPTVKPTPTLTSTQTPTSSQKDKEPKYLRSDKQREDSSSGIP